MRERFHDVALKVARLRTKLKPVKRLLYKLTSKQNRMNWKRAMVRNGNGKVWSLRQLQVIHPEDIRIAQGMITVGLFLITAKIIGALREVIIAHHYGVSKIVDAYALAFNFVNWLPQVAWSIGTAVLVPILVSLSKNPEEEQVFLREVNGSTVWLGFLTSAATAGLCGGLIPLLVKEWDTQAVCLAKKFTWWLIPLGFMTVLSASLSIRLQARGCYIYTFLESMPAFGIISFLLFFQKTQEGIPLIWGALIGGVIQVGLLFWIAKRTHSLGNGIAWRYHSTWWKQVYSNLTIMVVGQVAISLLILVDNAFAARLGEGAIATLGYANRITALLAGLGATVIGRALLPVLSQLVVNGDLKASRLTALKWSRLIFLGSGFITLLVWLFSFTVVTLLFQRGAFTAEDTMIVARVLRFDIIRLPFYCSSIALVQWFAATGRYSLLSSLGVLGLLTKIILNAILSPILGVAGIALATSGVYVIIMMVLLISIMKVKR